MKIFYTLLLALSFCVSAVTAQTIKLTPVITNIAAPLGVENCGDDRLFVVSRNGRIFVADANYTVAPLPFLNIANKVVAGGETGLLGLAFHPDYKNNGYFYVTYTRNNAGQLEDVVARYSVSVADSNRADSLSGEILLAVDDPYTNHNGGSIKFGPDGFLYVAFGDGGDRNDPQDNGQDMNELLGKIVRLDVNSGTPYSIPVGNPFVGVPNHREEIWAYGLRNPWRFSFDKLTGDLWIADVGQDHYEEIDFQAAGAQGGINYGWVCYEANTYINLGNFCPPADSNLVFPVYNYSHDNNGDCSITGGYVYRGTQIPELEGLYIFTDYCSGLIRSFNIADSSVVNLLDGTNETMSSFGEDVNGELYVCEIANNRVQRIDKTSTGFNDKVIGDVTITPNPSYGSIVISNTTNGTITSVEVMDITGRVVAMPVVNANAKSINVNLPEAKGVYFVRVKTDNNEFTQKVVRE